LNFFVVVGSPTGWMGIVVITRLWRKSSVEVIVLMMHDYLQEEAVAVAMAEPRHGGEEKERKGGGWDR
jgi:hypothetical protein